jgi:16S rRNA (adenine1518-N6/adenine1519-N6)-dimethyltransferase
LKADTLEMETKRLLRRYGLRSKKGLGQHFLTDEGVLKAIIQAAELAPDDIVIEVGPGLGVLTRELAGRVARLFTVELDSNLASVLERSLASRRNVSVINGNILEVDPASLLGEVPAGLPGLTGDYLSYKVVANLPYYITSPVLRHFLTAHIKPRVMVVMVQKEVAEAITAGPGRMSLLSLSVQLYGRPEIVSHVPARCFYPAPEVASAILKITVHPGPAVEISDEDSFFSLVRAGFSAARKQLANSLAQGLRLPKAEVLPRLQQAGIAPQRRAETLTLEEWAGLWRVFHQLKEGRTGC